MFKTSLIIIVISYAVFVRLLNQNKNGERKTFRIEQTTKHWDSWTVGSVVTLTMSYQQVSKKKYDEDEDFEDSEDAESDISESDFEDPDMMEVILYGASVKSEYGYGPRLYLYPARNFKTIVYYNCWIV